MPFLFVGWFWYLGSLVPVIGFVKSTDYAMADRFTYFPSIGIAIGLVWGIGFLFPREDIRRKILLPVGVFVLVVLAVLTWRQCGYWKNSVALSSHALRVTKDNYLSHVILGSALAGEGRMEEAIEQYNEAIRLKPYYTYSYNVRGIAFSDLGQYQRAIEDFNEGIRMRPDYADAYYNRGNAYSGLNQHQRALEDYSEVIRLSPDYVLAYLNRGNAYAILGQYQPAIENYNETIRLKPDNADAYYNRGMVYFMLGGKEPGCRDAQKACALGKCQLLETANSKGYCR
jgi:tetratricopeptide (TPR) repeat protein